MFPQGQLGWPCLGGLSLSLRQAVAAGPELATSTTGLSPSFIRQQQPFYHINRTHKPNRTQPRRVFQTCCYPSSQVPSFSITHSSPFIHRQYTRIFPIMATLSQTRSHSGHKHSHGHHHHDNVYLTSQNKNDAGVRITRIGLYSNLGMAIAKGAGGYLFNSKAMVADAIHSLTDLASDILTLATISWSLKPPTDKYPAGFGKIESLGSLGVSSMLLFGGLYMGYGSLLTLYGHFFLDPASAAELIAHAHAHGHSHSHGHEHGADVVPSLHAAWLAAGTVAIKEWLYHASKSSDQSDQSL
ncbi:hypothetical protein F5Y11DRAFT_290190 [Daldinia sp. FL1419]|nr:hypothetical protein F5Y11DRAFT_290190 [Daldinia sp. FL1419]